MGHQSQTRSAMPSASGKARSNATETGRAAQGTDSMNEKKPIRPPAMNLSASSKNGKTGLSRREAKPNIKSNER